MTQRLLSKFAFATILGSTVTGCAASVHFYSKTGQEFPELTSHAVIIENNEVDAVRSAGGFPIGTESGEGLSVNSTQEDVSAKAALVAGRKGGTHILRTEQGIQELTVTNPGQAQKTCTGGDDRIDCTTTYTPPTSSTYDKPTAKFVVFRVAPENWGKLPQTLRPVAQQ